MRYFDEALNPEKIINFEKNIPFSDTLAISASSFAYREEVKELKAIKYHRIRSGNTLSHIARKYGTTVNKLCRLNGISRNKILRIGQRLRVR